MTKPRKSRAKPPEKHKPDGRPTLYRAKYATLVFGYAVAGYTDKEISGFFEISESTLNLWKLKHPKFSESIKAGREPANANSAASLFKVANGYEVVNEQVVKVGDGFEVVRVKQYIPPDVSALKFLMKNRMPEKWRDKHEQVLTDPNGAGAFDVLAVEIAKQLAKDGV